MKGGDFMATKNINAVLETNTQQLDILIEKLNRIKKLLNEVTDIIGSIKNINIQLKINGQDLNFDDK